MGAFYNFLSYCQRGSLKKWHLVIQLFNCTTLRGQGMQLEIISTGDEVITGFINDTNASWLSQELLALGIQPVRRHTVGDRLEDIRDLIKERSLVCDLILVNGGLGPTSDDNTTQAAAMAANVKQVLNEEWLRRIEQWHIKRGRTMPQTNVKQAMLPEHAQIIDNKRGTACGFMLQINKAMCIFTPGVPSEFYQMYNDDILPYIKENFAENANTEVKRFFLFGVSESRLGALIEKHDIPESTVIGYRADYPLLELKIISNNATLDEKVFTLNTIKQIVKPYLIMKDTFNLDSEIARLLEGKVLNVFDSCTRGQVGHDLAMTVNMKRATVINPLDEHGTIVKESAQSFEHELRSLLPDTNHVCLSVLLLAINDADIEFAVIYTDEKRAEHKMHARLSLTLKEKKIATISLIARTFLYKHLRHKDMIEPDSMELLDTPIFAH